MLHNKEWFVNRDTNAFWQIYWSKSVIVELPTYRTSDEISD